MEKRKWLSLLLAVTMLFTSIPVGMFAEGEEPVVEETATVEEVTIEEPAPAPEVKEEPAPAPAPEKKEEPAPAPEKKEEPAPVVEEKEEPAPVVEEKEEPAPVAEEKEEPAPVVEEKEEPAPVVEEKEEPAPSEGGESVPAEGTEPAAEPVVTEEGEPEGDVVPEETGTEPAEAVTPVVEPEPVPEVEEVEEETEAFKAGLAYLSSGEVFEDKQLQKAYGTVNSKAVVYATDRITGEGELSGSDVIRISANIEGQEKTLYVKNGRLTYLSEDETADYNDEKHEEGIACRGTKLDPVSFTPAEKPESEVDPTEEPVPTEPTEEPAPTEPTGEEPTEEPVPTEPTGEEPTEEPVPTEPTGEEPTEEPVPTEPTGEEPTEKPVPTEPTVEEPADEPVPAEPTGEEPTEEPVPAEPTGEEPTETPTATEPVVEEETEETPTTTEPVEEEAEDEGETVLDITALLIQEPIENDDAETVETIGETEDTEESVETEEPDASEDEVVEDLVVREANGAVIVTPPEDVNVEETAETVTFTVEAQNVAAYQWQYSTNGTTWRASRASGYNTATVTIPVNAVNAANQYRCAITGLDGIVIYTDPVSFSIGSQSNAAVIVTPPASTNVEETAETVEFTVVAENVDAYQWQYSTNGTTWRASRASGYNTATVTIPVNAVNAANQYRCAITGLDGVTIYTDPVSFTIGTESTAAVIVTPPASTTVEATAETVSFTVVAENVDTYQWQYSTDGTTWRVSRATGNKTATVTIAVNDANAANQYRCAIKGLDGVTIYTDPVTFSIASAPAAAVIVTPPASTTVEATAETVSFTVVAENVDTYQWQYSTDGTTWKVSRATGNKTATVTIGVNDANAANQYRCAIKGLNGTTIYTDPVTFTIASAPAAAVIVTPPASTTVEATAETVSFTVIAENVDTYQWQYSTDGTTWKVSRATGNKTATVTIAVNDANAANQYRCAIKGLNGRTIYTDPVTFTIASAPAAAVIVTPPASTTVEATDETVSFTVVAENVDTYQWQYSTDGTTWKVSRATGNKTATVTITVNDANAANQYRCAIKGLNGVTIYTDPVTFTIASAPAGAVIVTPPASTTVEATDETVSFTVVAENVDTYQWQYSTDGTTWKVSRATGNKTDTVTITVNETNAANQYRCAIKGLDGVTIYTDPVTFSFATIPDPAVIVTPPESVTVEDTAETVSFTVVAENADTYQWQYSTDGTTWRDSRASGHDTATVTIPVNADNAANQYRCAITGLDGVTIYTDPVTFTIEIVRFVDNEVTYFILDATSVKVEAYSGSATSLVIPQTINGFTVTIIGEGAFENNTNLESIDLPDTITVIEARAFKNCSSLQDMH